MISIGYPLRFFLTKFFTYVSLKTMKPFKISRQEKLNRIRDYVNRQFTPSEIARELEISRQLAWYWIEQIKKENKK
jgi:transposase-like protein